MLAIMTMMMVNREEWELISRIDTFFSLRDNRGSKLNRRNCSHTSHTSSLSQSYPAYEEIHSLRSFSLRTIFELIFALDFQNIECGSTVEMRFRLGKLLSSYFLDGLIGADAW